MSETLAAPIRETNRRHLEQRGGVALKWLAFQMRQAGIRGKMKIQTTAGGRPAVVVYVQGIGVPEAKLSLPLFINGFRVSVV
jgi:hypothetical protein